jgi:AcrR family transcriptional regulator
LTTFYAAYPGKRELFRAIGEARHERLIEELRSINAERSSPERSLSSAIEATVDFYAERPALLQVLLRDGRNWSEDTSLPEDERESWRAGIAQYRSIFARGVEEGVFVAGDPAVMARVVAAILQVHLTHWLDHDRSYSIDRHPAGGAATRH